MCKFPANYCQAQVVSIVFISREPFAALECHIKYKNITGLRWLKVWNLLSAFEKIRGNKILY